MKNQYHVNPATGNVSQCSAKKKCPFGGASGKEHHYSDQQQALKAAETISHKIVEQEKSQKLRREQLLEAHQRYGKNITPFTMEFSQDVHELLSALKTHGFRPLLAGGAVRDAITNKNQAEGVLQIDSKDLDFEVYLDNPENTSINNNNATESLIKAGRTVGNVDEVGKSFGVLKMTLKDGTDIDLSLPRRESKTGEGHTGFDVDSDITMSVEEASARRDFTLNSMMYDNETNVLIDPHNGLEDLKSNRLKHTSDAFAEDPLRVMRSFQFASRFGLKLDKDTVAFSQSLYSEYDTISEERIQTEWDKWASKGKKPSSGLQVLHDTGWEKGFAGLEAANTVHTQQSVDETAKLCDKDDKLDRKVMLPATIAASMTDKEDRRKFVNKAIIGVRGQRRALALADSADNDYSGVSIEAIDSPSAAKQASLDTRTSLRERLALYKALNASNEDKNLTDKVNQIERSIEKSGVRDKPEEDLVDGNDLLALTERKPGRWMSEAITDLRLAQAQEKFSNKAEGLAYAKNTLSDKPSAESIRKSAERSAKASAKLEGRVVPDYYDRPAEIADFLHKRRNRRDIN